MLTIYCGKDGLPIEYSKTELIFTQNYDTINARILRIGSEEYAKDSSYFGFAQ